MALNTNQSYLEPTPDTSTPGRYYFRPITRADYDFSKVEIVCSGYM